MRFAFWIGCSLALLAALAPTRAEIQFAEVPELEFPPWPVAKPATTRPLDDVTFVVTRNAFRIESERCLTLPGTERRDQVTSLDVTVATRIVRSERMVHRDGRALLLVEHLFLEPSARRVRGDGEREIPLKNIETAAGVEIFAFREPGAVHLIVPVEAQMVFRDALGSGECVCKHIHLLLRLTDAAPPHGSSALAIGALGIDAPSNSARRVLTVAASVSRVARDRAPRLSLTTSVRGILPPRKRPCANDPSCSP